MPHNEAYESTEMVAVGMTEDQAINLLRGDIEKIKILVDDLRCIAKVENVLGGEAHFLGRQMQ